MHSRMLLYLGKVQEAEQGVRQALAIHPDQFKAMAYLGEFLYYQGRSDEAEPILRRAVELSRDSGDEIRSEEHTSELQSPCNLVCRLLLEKKNTSCISVLLTRL